MANISYEEFEPFCKWRKEANKDVLEVHLKGFNKNQLRVQINNVGVLTISGECPVDETRWSRFRKEINVTDCRPDDIHAKFSGGILSITIQKNCSSLKPPNQPTLPQKVKENEKPNQQINEDKESKGFEAKESSARDNIIAAATEKGSTLSTMSKLRTDQMIGSITGLKVGGKTALKLGALTGVVMVVSIGAYIAYKYRRFHVED